jgi:hypothetical protein
MAQGNRESLSWREERAKSRLYQPSSQDHIQPEPHSEREVGPEQAVSRILFLPRFAAAAGSNHLSRTAITRRLQQPTRRDNGRATRRHHRHADAAIPPVWPCSRWGLPQPIGHPIAGERLPRHFTLTCCQAVCFCGTFPGVAPAGRYPASRSVEFGLSSGSPQATRDCFAYSDPKYNISHSDACLLLRHHHATGDLCSSLISPARAEVRPKIAEKNLT